MNKELIVFVAAVALLSLLILPVVTATLGALAGLVVSLFWNDTILGVLQAMGMPKGIQLWHIGCTLGFVGGFFRTNISTTSKD